MRDVTIQMKKNVLRKYNANTGELETIEESSKFIIIHGLCDDIEMNNVIEVEIEITGKFNVTINQITKWMGEYNES